MNNHVPPPPPPMPGALPPPPPPPGVGGPHQQQLVPQNFPMQGQMGPNNQLVKQPQAPGQVIGQKGAVPYTMPTYLDLRDDIDFGDASNLVQYEAWSLRRAPPEPGHGPSWARINLSKMAISSKEIIASYHKQIKSQSGQITKIYKELKSDKMRTAIDKSVSARNAAEQDRNCEWQLVHLDVTKRPLKGTIGNSAVETSQIVVILKKSYKPEILAALRAQQLQRLNQPIPLMHQQPAFNPQPNPGQHPQQQQQQQQPRHPQGNVLPPPPMGPMQHQPPPAIVQHFNVPNQQNNSKNKSPGGKVERDRPGSRGRGRSMSPSSKRKVENYLSKLDYPRHPHSNSDDSDLETVEIKEFRRKIAKHHGKDSAEYRRLMRDFDRARDGRKGKNRPRQRSPTPGPPTTRRHSLRKHHHHRDGSDSDDSWDIVDRSSNGGSVRSDFDSPPSSWDDQWARDRRRGDRRRGGDIRRRSDYALARLPSLERETGWRRRSRTPIGRGDSVVKHVYEYRVVDDAADYRGRPLPLRTISYPSSSSRLPPPPVPEIHRRLPRQEEEAMRYQEERRAYQRGRLDAEREQMSSWDGETTSDYERRLEREIRATRGRVGSLGRRYSALDDWPEFRRNEWP